MNSEELELSLRDEFENYLKGVLDTMRGDVVEFQKKLEAEFEKQRSQMNEAFQSFSEHFEKMPAFDGGFRETVVEHLRLARDEGAKITATAIAEAEELERASSPVVDLGEIREAITDISTKDSQSAILKTLVQHAAKYTPRGAFFIIKNEHFVGWKVFGKESGEGESAVRDIHFPTSSDSILSAAIRSLATVEGSFGTYTEDTTFLDPLHFGKPDRMYAIPLIARGRGVAVLYCDYGHEGVMVNTDAIEMLVAVAGLTVELLASTKAFRSEPQPEAHGDLASSYDDTDVFKSATFNAPLRTTEVTLSPAVNPFEEPVVEQAETPASPAFEEPAPPVETAPAFTAPTFEAPPPFDPPKFEVPANDFDYRSQFDMAPEYVPDAPSSIFETNSSFQTAEFETTRTDDQPAVTGPLDEHKLSQELSDYQPAPPVPEKTFDSTLSPGAEIYGMPPAADVPVYTPEPVVETPQFQPSPAFEPTAFEAPAPEAPVFEPTAFEAPAPAPAPATLERGMTPFEAPTANGTPAPAPVIEPIVAKPAGGRLSDRHVDLPIEVAEDERRLHNDARRFARLLVSEIKLYNEKRVQEGRDNKDLYERLREAIDRSREMYDKRVQPAVASKFDYFHYELVNSLAEGDETKLGTSYKGASV